ncbi:hypothetical protein FQA39_LY00353 [Lamprigera yunnana]|nr:hypothetical protein FQA39_LY00353 [Lamprigera yunnana]
MILYFQIQVITEASLPNQVIILFEEPNTSEFDPTASTISQDLVTDWSSSYAPNNCALSDRNIPEEKSDSVYEILTPLHFNTDSSDYNENSASNENSFQSSTSNDVSETSELLTRKFKTRKTKLAERVGNLKNQGSLHFVLWLIKEHDKFAIVKQVIERENEKEEKRYLLFSDLETATDTVPERNI